MDKPLVACIIIKPATNGFHIRIIRENGVHKDWIVWSTKALFFTIADMLDFDLSKHDFTYTHNGENDEDKSN